MAVHKNYEITANATKGRREVRADRDPWLANMWLNIHLINIFYIINLIPVVSTEVVGVTVDTVVSVGVVG